MLKEFIDRIAELARQARGPFVVKPGAEPEHVYWLCDDTHNLRMAAEPRPRQHQADSLDTLIEFAKRAREEYLAQPGSDAEKITTVVWYSQKGVVCLCDDATRRDRVSLPFKVSKQIEVLQLLESTRKMFAQKEFVTLLKLTFHNCLVEAPGLLELARRLKFRKDSSGEAIVEHGKSSIGRQLKAELAGVTDFPEYVRLQVPVFSHSLVMRQPVLCGLEICPEAETLGLEPLPGEIDEAIARAEMQLGMLLTQDLAEDEIPVYHGVP